MNKDVIYIDVEDDITAIIGKVKGAKEKIVALVPPKRIGVLQSAVNLRLLARAAKQADKRLVLITNNAALGALASAASVPVAKNLQSKPELAEIAALDVDNGEDVIDGAKLPVGELARTAGPGAMGAAAADSLAAGEKEDTAGLARATPPAPGQSPRKPKAKGGAKVPNFSKFRKKMALLVGGGVLLVAFLIWAIFFAPHATVVITARTTDSSTNEKVTLGDALSTDASASTIKTLTERIEKDASTEFTPTGKKDVGEKAKGTMQLTRTSVSNQPLAVPAGTSFSSGNYTFVSTQDATLGGTTVGPNGIEQDSATVSVVATKMGDDYNLSARAYQSNVGGISAQGSDMSGGSKKTVTVVSASDVKAAAEQLAQESGDDMMQQLKDKFDDKYIVLDQTFATDHGTPQSSPAVGQEVSGKAKLTSHVTYSMAAVAKSEVDSFLDAYFNEQIDGKNDRRVYDNGAQKVSFTNVAEAEKSFTANIVATAKIGPKIDDNHIKDVAKGKRYGEIQSAIESIQGVDDVDIKYWPFWVSVAPNDTKKISVDFNLNEAK